MKRKRNFSNNPSSYNTTEKFKEAITGLDLKRSLEAQSNYYKWIIDLQSYVLYKMPLSELDNFVNHADLPCLPVGETILRVNERAFRQRLLEVIPVIRKQNRSLEPFDLGSLIISGWEGDIYMAGKTYWIRQNEFE